MKKILVAIILVISMLISSLALLGCGPWGYILGGAAGGAAGCAMFSCAEEACSEAEGYVESEEYAEQVQQVAPEEEDCEFCGGCGCGCDCSCDDEESTSPTTQGNGLLPGPLAGDKSGEVRALGLNDISVNSTSIVFDGLAQNAVTKATCGVSVTGRNGYVYLDCSVTITWTYELMDTDGIYHRRTIKKTVELDRMGCASYEDVSASAIGLSARQIGSATYTVSGRVSVK